MVRILRYICAPLDQDTSPFDLYLDLYEEGFEREVLDVWKDYYGWSFNLILPQIYDGEFFVKQRALKATFLHVRRTIEGKGVRIDEVTKGRDILI